MFFFYLTSRLAWKNLYFDTTFLLLRAVLQQQSQRAQVSLGSGVVNGEGPCVRGSPRVSLAAFQQPLGDLVVTEAGCEVKDGGTGAVPVLRVRQNRGCVIVPGYATIQHI